MVDICMYHAVVCDVIHVSPEDIFPLGKNLSFHNRFTCSSDNHMWSSSIA